MSVAVQTIAATGVQRTAHFAVIAPITRAGNIEAAHLGVTVNTGVVLTGTAFGLHIEANVLGTGQTPQNLEGVRIEVGAAPASNIGNIYGIFMTNFVEAGATYVNYYFMRLVDNGGNIVTAAFQLQVGNGSDMTNLFELTNPCTAWSSTVVPPGPITGRIAVRCQGLQFYLPLYQ
jgi:hypothetical protein